MNKTTKSVVNKVLEILPESFDIQTLVNIVKELNVESVEELTPKEVWENFYKNPEELSKREHILAKDAQYSYCYAHYVLLKPFPLGENAISKSAKYSYLYAKYVLKGRFELGEAEISTDAGYSYGYAHYILKNKPFPLGEEAIAKDAYYSYWYVKDILKGRFELGEPAIAKDAYWNETYQKFLKTLKPNLKESSEDQEYGIFKYHANPKSLPDLARSNRKNSLKIIS